MQLCSNHTKILSVHQTNEAVLHFRAFAHAVFLLLKMLAQLMGLFLFHRVSSNAQLVAPYA